MCVCVRACMHACVCACVHAHTCECLPMFVHKNKTVHLIISLTNPDIAEDG